MLFALLVLAVLPPATPRFSLSEENEATGEGDSDSTLTRSCSRCALPARVCTSASCSSSSERFARRAMLETVK